MEESPLVVAFRLQAGACRHFGSPFYADLMDRVLIDVEAGGCVSQLLADFEEDPVRGFLPLRLFGAVHHQVLRGHAPSLAAFYPSAGGKADGKAAWPEFLRIIEHEGDALKERLGAFPQTNEVRRCGGLLGGFLEVAHQTGLPLRLREIGCSAGLNLQWRRYRYRVRDQLWGEESSEVEIAPDWQGPLPRLDTVVEVESRAGCDLDPPRIADEEAVETLESFIWADQPERLDHLRSAVAIARSDPPRVDKERALPWLERELAEQAPGRCTVVYHSSVWTYIHPDERAAIRSLLEKRGASASAEAPLAWVRHDDGEKPAAIEIRARLWPGRGERLLGYGHPHGRKVEWLA